MTTQSVFNNTNLSIININDEIYLTSKDLAIALGYASYKSVTDIYNKNQDEFTPCMSQVVKSTTSGNYQKSVRIFSLRGAHLIAMFSRTAIAKEFRKWVLDILDKEVANTVSVTPKLSYRTVQVSKVNIEALINHMEWIYKYYKEYNLLEVSRSLKSDFGAKLHDHIIDGYLNARSII